MGALLRALLSMLKVGGKQAVKHPVKTGVAVATTVEATTLALDTAAAVSEYQKALAEAKKILTDLAKSIKEEIDLKIDTKQEVRILLKLQDADPQSQMTKKGEGRGGSTNNVIKTAIQQKVPFRKVIAKVCEQANETPEMILRKRNPNHKNQKLQASDIASKKKLIATMLGKAVEAVTEQDLKDYTLVKLKQLMASVLFEVLDATFDWTSPLKAEVCFKLLTNKSYIFGHPQDTPKTKLKRIGLEMNPFWPPPMKTKELGAQVIIADLVIPEYRHEPCDGFNLFSIVEIKFPGDTINARQFDGYRELLSASVKMKMSKFKSIAFTNKIRTPAKLTLFRYPEDMPEVKKTSDGKQKPTNKKR